MPPAKQNSVTLNVISLHLQLYRILVGDPSAAATHSRVRLKRDAGLLQEFRDKLHRHLSDIPDLTDTETSIFNDLTDASSSLLDNILAASHLPTNGIIYQLIRDNPKLLLNPEVQRLVIKLLKAASRQEMESFVETYSVSEIIAILKVK